MAERDLFPWIERRKGLTALAALVAFGGSAASADAAITSTVTGSAPNKALSIVGDGAADGVTLACNAGNVEVNGAAPSPGPAAACADIGSISIDGGGGNDTVDLDDLDFNTDFPGVED